MSGIAQNRLGVLHEQDMDVAQELAPHGRVPVLHDSRQRRGGNAQCLAIHLHQAAVRRAHRAKHSRDANETKVPDQGYFNGAGGCARKSTRRRVR